MKNFIHDDSQDSSIMLKININIALLKKLILRASILS